MLGKNCWLENTQASGSLAQQQEDEIMERSRSDTAPAKNTRCRSSENRLLFHPNRCCLGNSSYRLKRKEKIDKQIKAQSSSIDTVDTSSSSTRVLGTYKFVSPSKPVMAISDSGVPRSLRPSLTVNRYRKPTFRLFSSPHLCFPSRCRFTPHPVIVPNWPFDRSLSL